MTCSFLGKEIGQGKILHTDYENFLVFYKCAPSWGDGSFRQMVGISVRNPDLSEEERQNIWEQALDKVNDAFVGAEESQRYNAEINLELNKQGSENGCEYYHTPV